MPSDSCDQLFVSYLVVELGVQAVRPILGFPPLLLSPPLHLRKTVVNPGREKVLRQKRAATSGPTNAFRK